MRGRAPDPPKEANATSAAPRRRKRLATKGFGCRWRYQTRCHYCVPALIIDSIKMAVKLGAAISGEHAVCFRVLSHGIIKCS